MKSQPSTAVWLAWLSGSLCFLYPLLACPLGCRTEDKLRKHCEPRTRLSDTLACLRYPKASACEHSFGQGPVGCLLQFLHCGSYSLGRSRTSVGILANVKGLKSKRWSTPHFLCMLCSCHGSGCLLLSIPAANTILLIFVWDISGRKNWRLKLALCWGSCYPT